MVLTVKNPVHYNPPMDPATVARIFNVPVERVREQYRRNARQLSRMADKAKNGKVNGYTRADLLRLAESALQKSNQ